MVLFVSLPLQSDDVELYANSAETLEFAVTLDGAVVSNIASARFVIARAIPSSDFVVDVVCSVDVGGGICTAAVPPLTIGDYIGELSVTLADGNVFTPWQAGIHVL
jgi:hypothetical protein